MSRETSNPQEDRETELETADSRHSRSEHVDDALFDAIRPRGSDAKRDELPKRIRRYRVEKLLGAGTFGKVYLAHDDQLRRAVAIKVPTAEALSQPGQAEVYLAEARTIATLEHPNIVPVYDVGSTYDFPCFIVTRYIDGTDLSEYSRQQELSRTDAVRLVVTIAHALQYAHERGVVHRDVKPDNVLIDREGKPYLVDLGLALTNENAGRGPKTLGTPAYMSPEQARGEGHRVDGRTDIYSLGVVLYELLAGRRPFDVESFHAMLFQIVHEPPPVLRQFDDSIPQELERICLRSLAKWPADRYAAAADFADELEAFLEEETGGTGTTTTRKKVTLVPKGLRHYDRQDADGFIALLPGPFDRHGIPDSIAFWKQRIDPLTDPTNRAPFDIGVIYGPSGCGKSSLVQAGLIPKLSDRVTVVFIQATATETEQRLLDQLRRKFPTLLEESDLTESLQQLRTDESLRRGGKVLIVLDQFEQWLSRQKLSAAEYKLSPLASALRQCDGRTLQSILLIRDEFWVSITEFLRAVDVKMSEGFNLRCVSPFDDDHARRVLHILGSAYQKLPADAEQLSSSQQEFLTTAVNEISEDGRTTSIKIALTAEMLKGQEWTPATLKQIGGLQGIGVRYLEQQFDDATAPPHHRRYRKRIEALLSAMLPPVGESIRGQRMSVSALAAACGLTVDSREFQELLEILDRDTRIITPVDTTDDETSGDEQSYQLTHDYLVRALRDWLTRKQKQTRSGRAALRLAERADSWNSRPQNRNLPAWWEYATIRLLTSPKTWTASQKKMMAKAGRVLGVRWGAGLMILVVMGIGLERYLHANQLESQRIQTRSAVAGMASARSILIPRAIRDLKELPREMVVAELRRQYADASAEDKLPLAYALADYGDDRVDFLVSQVATLPPAEIDNLSTALSKSPTRSRALAEAISLADDDKNWRLKSRYALVSLVIGEEAPTLQMCRLLPDPIERTFFIDECSVWHGDLSKLAPIISDCKTGPLRSALILIAGSTPESQLSPSEKQACQPVLDKYYKSAADALTHCSADWTLRRWGMPRPEVATSVRPPVGRHWNINSLGLTMVEIPAGSFVRKDTRLHISDPVEQTVTLTHAFLLSDREVTQEQFLKFVDDPATDPLFGWQDNRERTASPSVRHPMQVSWYYAVRFCNWLSGQEGLSPCYDDVSASQKEPSQYGTWRLNPEANGYRLPTEAEWEYACRAGTMTAYGFGDDPSFLDRYGVVRVYQSEIPGSRLPNAWGLFDLHGNMVEWCYDWYGGYGDQTDVRDPITLWEAENRRNFRILRGGAFTSEPQHVLSSYRGKTDSESGKYFDRGFRVARTIEAESFD